MTDQPAKTASNRTADAGRTRGALRRDKIAARLALPAAAHRAASITILHHLTELLLPRPAGTLGFCWPIRAEVDCRPLIERLLKAGWCSAMPTVVEVNQPLMFRAWWPAAPMSQDPYGIPVPATEAVQAPDTLLVPLVAFNSDGYRLGYGGGYFDRTLAALAPRPLTIGVGFELCASPNLKPEPHDVPLDLIVTEAGIRRFTAPDPRRAWAERST